MNRIRKRRRTCSPYLSGWECRWCLFGVEEPKLYRLLFMQEHNSAVTFDDVFGELGTTADMCIDAICGDYGLDRETAKKLFENVWIYTFGVGALCASKMCSFSKERLSSMLTTEFKAMMMLVKSGVIDCEERF